MTSMLPAITLATIGAFANTPIVHIEKIYWDCDYAVNQGLVDLSDAEYCSEAFEHLKAVKFDNDFNKFLQWWKANKGPENARRANRQRMRNR